MSDAIKIAVIVPNRPFFGNILTQLPLFQAIRELYPSAHICVWSKTPMSQLIVNNGFADQLIIYKEIGIFSLFKKFRAESYQQVYNIYSGSEKMHLLSLLSGADKTYGLSNSKWVRRCYNKHLEVDKGSSYIALKNIALINYVHNTTFKPSIIKALVSPSKIEPKYITFLPGGGAGNYKRWSIQNYCQVFKDICLQTKHHKGMFILGPKEAHYKAVIEQELSGFDYEIQESPSLHNLMNIAIQSKLTIANDCGPMHLFQMLETPLLTLWGWKQEYSPFSTLSEWFYSTENAFAIVPTEEEKNINSISVEKVLSMALMQLKRLNN